MIRVYKIYVQPVVQYAVLVYGLTTKSVLLPIDSRVNRLLRIIFSKKKLGSTTKTLELHIYELLKLLIKVIRKNAMSNKINTQS